MANSQMYGGSICITDLLDQLNKRHSAFSKSPKNNKVYCDCIVWVNEEKDEYGHNISFQFSSKKEKRESEGKIYFGNARKIEAKPIVERDLPKNDWDANIPVREPEQNNQSTAPIADDLPF